MVTHTWECLSIFLIRSGHRWPDGSAVTSIKMRWLPELSKNEAKKSCFEWRCPLNSFRCFQDHCFKIIRRIADGQLTHLLRRKIWILAFVDLPTMH